MYSREAIELYRELLKEASLAAAPLVKQAGVLDFARKMIFPGVGKIEQMGAKNIATAMNPGRVLANATRGEGEAALISRFGKGTGAATSALDPHMLPAGSAAMPRSGQMPPAAPQTPPTGGGHGQLLGGMALGGAAAGTGGYALGKHFQHERDRTQRNLALGAGAAAGFALPGMLRGAADAAQNVALSPSSLFAGMNRGY